MTVSGSPVVDTSASPAHSRRAPPPIRGMRAAFALLTRIPIGGFPYRSEDWTWAAAHTPFVGLVIGAGLGALDHALLPLGGAAAAMLVIGASLLVTGCMHEDGLADTSDALGGARDTAHLFQILKDSRVGSFGAAALVVSIGGRAALLAQLGESALWALPLVGCVARVGPIWLVASLPYVTPASEAKSSHVARSGIPQACVASAWWLAAAGACVASRMVSVSRVSAVTTVVAIVTLVTGLRYQRRAAGITGDFLGATEQLCELAAFAVLAWRC